ncbi:MAG: class I SAM-dependent methyltransferase [Oscillospiraceae bacterium]|nr:class I SAM-dependent methyltransferase [Oscillospiraceae bacterium]
MPEHLNLKPRLRRIAELVPADCRCLADTGTDHGYIPVELLVRGRVRQAIATDINPAPLERARQTARRCGVTEKIDFRLGDGLSVLAPGEADVIIIAGMGGDNICDILNAAPWTKNGPLLLLQPMSRAETLRRYLAETGCLVQAECLVQDKGVLYPVLSAGGTAEAYSCPDADAWGGFRLQNDPLWGAYLEGMILRLRRAAAGLEKASGPALAERRMQFLSICKELEIRKEVWMRAGCTRH